MNKQILFIHIPKTAGTSFRLAAKKYFGEENTFFDYNVSSVETSSIIQEHIYRDKDFYALHEKFSKYKQMFLSGHFHAAKYAPLFDTTNTVTFVRNPVDQVISHYKHFVAHSNYKNSIESFIKEKRFQNIQSKMLAGRSLELYGLIGLTEEYSKSIELINHYYDLNLETLTLNTASDKNKFDDEIIELIKKENEKDIELYEKAKEIFYKHLDCFQNNQPYTYSFLHEINEHKIRGLAFQKNNNKPIEIEIFNDDELLATVYATDFRPGIVSYSASRKGYVGFEYKFDTPPNLANIKVIVKNTKQEII